MPRTTPELIAEIIEVDTDIPLEPFITIANELVSERCATGVTPAYTTARLELIERWLAAHFYTVRDPRMTSRGVDVIQQSWQSAIGRGFKTSHFGQTAMRLDTAGRLAKLDAAIEDPTKKRSVGINFIGTTPEERGWET
jgi:hypothetical protein